MPSLSVRKLDQETYERLRIRAATESVSMEEAARRILKRAVAAPERLSDLARELFGSEHGVALELPKRDPHQPVEFER